MKAQLIAPFAVALLGLAATAGAATKEPSRISAFAGPHNGTLFFVGNVGTTTGSFKASKKKEVGSVTLQSVIPTGGPALVLIEQFSFHKNAVTWSLTESGASTFLVTGVGTAQIKKNNTITYSIPISLSGTTALLQGSMKLAKNHHLAIQETISGGGTAAAIIYQLGGKKPKK